MKKFKTDKNHGKGAKQTTKYKHTRNNNSKMSFDL